MENQDSNKREAPIDELQNSISTHVEKMRAILEKQQEVKFWEIFSGVGSEASIKVEKGFLKESELDSNGLITLRVYGDKGNIGSATIGHINEKTIEYAINDAMGLMRVSTPDPDFVDLVYPAQYHNIKPVWDSKIANLDIEDCADIIDIMLNQRNRDSKIKSISGGFSFEDSRIFLVNSNGIEVSEKDTSISLYTEFTLETLKDGNKINSNGFDWQAYNRYKELNASEIIENAYSMAIKGLNKTKILSKAYDVILSPSMVNLLFTSSIISAINGEKIHQKRSFLVDKIDTPILNDKITIIDDPWMENGFANSAFDAEGSPTKPLNIVEDGVLKSYLHNSYTANILKMENTGHASRSWYSPSISIQTYNTQIKPGTQTSKSLIEGIEDGIYLDKSYDSPNIVTGEFSGLITNGYRIKNGEIQEAVDETMLGCDLLELYQKVESVSKDIIRKSSTYLPTIFIKDVFLSGSQ